MMSKKEKQLLADLQKANADLMARLEKIETSLTPKKEIAKAVKINGKSTKKSALAKKLEKKVEIVEETEEIKEQLEIPEFANQESKIAKVNATDGDIPQQVYFDKLIQDGDTLKKVRCRGYIKEYKGVSYGVAYKSYPKGKKDYAKGENCWDIVISDFGLSIGRCSHLTELESKLKETETRVAKIFADKKQVKKYKEQFSKAPMLA